MLGRGVRQSPVGSPPASLLLPVLVLAVVTTCEGTCYFSIAFQGQFLMQSAVTQNGGGVGSGASVRYSQVNITADEIPIWGRCHRRIGSNVILKDSSGATNCIRCFRLTLRSANVLQVHSEGLDKCYTNEEAAVATCPSDAPRGHASKEIILYKTRDHNGDEIRPQYCPVNGRFSFTYSGDRGGGRRACSFSEMSELDTCPSGSQLNMRYRSCNFPDFDASYACLGHWEGPGNQHYLVLLNLAVDAFSKFPRYRCAMYLEEPGTGSILMAFSSDSTCRSDLRNSTSGYETLQLMAAPVPRWPDSVEQSTCRFPSWTQGRWQHLEMEGSTLVYRDHSTFKTYTARCLGPMLGPEAERFQVFARTQCGEQMYSCVWIKRRSDNVLEFQMGVRTSSDIDSSLCEDANFKPQTWITQARLDRSRETPCPVSGEYTGVIPDAQGLCARLSSNCRYPESMFYVVSECTQAEVYEGSRWRGRRRRRRRRRSTPRIYHIRTPPTSPRPEEAASTAPPTAPSPAASDAAPAAPAAAAPDSTPYPEEYDPWTFGKTPSPVSSNRSLGTSAVPWGASTGYGPPLPSQPPPARPFRPERQYPGYGGELSQRPQGPYGNANEHREPGAVYREHRGWDGAGEATPAATGTGWAIPVSRDHHSAPPPPPPPPPSSASPDSRPPFRDSAHQAPRDPYRDPAPIDSRGPYRDRVPQDPRRPYRDPARQDSPSPYPTSSLQDSRGPYHDSSSQDTRINYQNPSSQDSRIPYRDPSPQDSRGPYHNSPSQDPRSPYPSPSPQDSRGPYLNPSSQDSRIPYRDPSSQDSRGPYPSPTPENSRGPYQNPSSQNTRIPYRDPSSQDSRGPYPSPSPEGSRGPYHNPSSQDPRVPYRDPAPQDPYRNPAPYEPQQRGGGGGGSGGSEGRGAHSPPYVPYPPPYGRPPPSSTSPGAQSREPANASRRRLAGPVTPIALPPAPLDAHRILDVRPGAVKPPPTPLPPMDVTRRRDDGPRAPFGAAPHGSAPHAAAPFAAPPPTTANRSTLSSQTLSFHGDPAPPAWKAGPAGGGWGRERERGGSGVRPPPPPHTLPQRRRPTAAYTEEREYRCLGQWEENGLTYTYTQRQDVGTFECFVGSIVSGDEIYIKEAGDHCIRNINPLQYGMKLSRKGPCVGGRPDGVSPGRPQTTSPWLSSKYAPEPTKPWKPVTAPPRDPNSSRGATLYIECPVLLLLTVILVGRAIP